MAKERVIQFGEGGFLRGFVDYFLYNRSDNEMCGRKDEMIWLPEINIREKK